MNDLEKLALEAEKELFEAFSYIDSVARTNQAKVMDIFAKHRVSDTHFVSTEGYGYNDFGRDTIEAIFADIFDTQAALVRHNIVSGTHALAIGLFGLLRPGDTMLSVTGKPYDTLDEVIGLRGEGNGSLRDLGIRYDEVPLLDGKLDADGVKNKLAEKVKVIFIQRSKGYSVRPTLSVDEIGDFVKKIRPLTDAFIVVDNCYGEFCETREPTSVGVDLCIGSLIKNLGGGMAESGGYLAGTARAVELATYRFTCPGIGAEGGATLGQNKSLIKGVFYAPHTVAQALKTAVFAAKLFEKLGFEVSPRAEEKRYDIIQMLSLKTPELLCAFCEGIQSASPINSHVCPIPDDMPGYADKVIMAAGAFTQGASIELSADAPMREPYVAYLQGGLTYESGRYGIINAAKKVLEKYQQS